MPRFDISIDAFLSECHGSDIKEIIKSLADDGHLKGYSPTSGNFTVDYLYEDLTPEEVDDLVQILKDEQVITDVAVAHFGCPTEVLFEEALIKIHGKWNCLTAEEEELIKKIANRF